MKYLRTILYVTVLIIGVCFSLIAVAAGIGLFYGMYVLIGEMISETRSQELFGLVVFGGSLILLMYLVMKSPNMILWAWRNLKKKQ